MNKSPLNTISIINRKSLSTSNYRLRIDTSGYYYLDKNYNWRSDGLLVSVFTFSIRNKEYRWKFIGWNKNESLRNSMFFNSFEIISQ